MKSDEKIVDMRFRQSKSVDRSVWSQNCLLLVSSPSFSRWGKFLWFRFRLYHAVPISELKTVSELKRRWKMLFWGTDFCTQHWIHFPYPLREVNLVLTFQKKKPRGTRFHAGNVNSIQFNSTAFKNYENRLKNRLRTANGLILSWIQESFFSL